MYHGDIQMALPSLFIYALTILCFIMPAFAQTDYVGVNLACAEFGENNLPGIHNTHYRYPTQNEVDYFMGKGMNTFRLPFRWERLQHNQNSAFNSTELSRIENFVDYATGNGASVILDPHNYGRYYGDIIGSSNLPASAFADFWNKLAEHFKDNPGVIFGLMNEPHTMSSELWRDDANAAIAAIRSTGATNLILVPGNGWSGAFSWYHNWYGTPNSVTMLTIVDPLDNFAFELHQYLDDNSSGTSETCVGSTIGSQRLAGVTNWLRQNGKRGFLGEFGASSNQTCLSGLDDMLDFVDNNRDVWLGWTYWAAGPWWGNYFLSIEPQNGQDRPQMAVLEQHMTTPTGVDTPPLASNIPGEFSLAQNYPNPFNNRTTIAFSLPQPGFASIAIFNNMGQLIETLVSDYLPGGDHRVSWDAGQLASGTYYYRLQVGNHSEVKKLVLQR